MSDFQDWPICTTGDTKNQESILRIRLELVATFGRQAIDWCPLGILNDCLLVADREPSLPFFFASLQEVLEARDQALPHHERIPIGGGDYFVLVRRQEDDCWWRVPPPTEEGGSGE